MCFISPILLNSGVTGNIAVIHSVLGELSDPTNQSIILPIYALCWPLGVVIGPMLGGAFSNPADKFPLLDVPFLRRYPYAMPCIVSAVISVFGATLAYFLMEEVEFLTICLLRCALLTNGSQ